MSFGAALGFLLLRRWAAWDGRPVVRAQPLFWEQGRNATFKSPIGRDRSPNLAVREGEWKLLLNADGSGVELYDAIADRAEKLDLAAVKPELAKRLLAEENPTIKPTNETQNTPSDIRNAG